MRDRALGSTIRLMFNSTNPDGGGAPVAPSSAFAPADIRIYKDGSASEKTSTNGITVTSPFDSIVGLHLVEIDTSNSTGDTGFWASGSVYQVRLVTAKTVATYSVSGLQIGEFSLEVQTADVRKFGGTAITQSGGRPEVNVSHIGGDAQSLADLKDFADAGYDPSTNKLTGAVELDSTTQTQINNIETSLTTLGSESTTVERSTADTNAITFSWPVSGATITGTRSLNNGSYGAVDGAIAFLRSETGKHYYTLAYNSADRPAAEGQVRYKFVDGTYTGYVVLRTVNLVTEAQVNAQVLDVLSVDTFAELAAPPAATSSLKDKITWLFMWLRNKGTATATQRKLYADDTTTVVSTETITDDGTTFTKGKAS